LLPLCNFRKSPIAWRKPPFTRDIDECNQSGELVIAPREKSWFSPLPKKAITGGAAVERPAR